jgi:hypothetical protein
MTGCTVHPQKGICDDQRMTDSPQLPDSPPPRINTSSAKIALYPVHGIVISTMLCSLAAAVVMLYINYRALGNDSLARKIALGGGGLYMLLIMLSSQLAPSLTFALIAMVIQGTIAYVLATTLQGAAISYHRDQGGIIHSNLRSVMVGFITGFALLFLLVAASLIVAGITGDLGVAPSESGLPA